MPVKKLNYVNEGREHINFSEWYKQPAEKRQKIKEDMIEEIEEEKMPLQPYVIMHPVAELSDEQKQVLKNWVTVKTDSI